MQGFEVWIKICLLIKSNGFLVFLFVLGCLFVCLFVCQIILLQRKPVSLRENQTSKLGVLVLKPYATVHPGHSLPSRALLLGLYLTAAWASGRIQGPLLLPSSLPWKDQDLEKKEPLLPSEQLLADCKSIHGNHRLLGLFISNFFPGKRRWLCLTNFYCMEIAKFD